MKMNIKIKFEPANRRPDAAGVETVGDRFTKTKIKFLIW